MTELLDDLDFEDAPIMYKDEIFKVLSLPEDEFRAWCLEHDPFLAPGENFCGTMGLEPHLTQEVAWMRNMLLEMYSRVS